MTDPNAHVKAFLDYYVAAKEPLGYAVLLNGPWGVGKTYLIKRYFEECSVPNDGYIYLSLFGVRTTEDLQRNLFAAAYPILSGKSAQVLSSLTKTGLGFFNLNSDLKLSKIKQIPKGKVIIVDDLERCSLSVHDALGLLNALVEHDGYKMLILAHEHEIAEAEKAGYLKQREKLIGQVLLVRSDLSGATEYFFSKISDDWTRAFFKRHRKEVQSVYEQSEANSLRILQQTLWHFERLCRSLDKKFRAVDEGMLALMRLFLALSFEYRKGNLTRDDLKNRSSGLLAAMRAARQGAVEDRLAVCAAKYPGLDLRDEALTNDMLVQILVDGYFDVEAIDQNLSNSKHYRQLRAEDSWQTVWYGVKREPTQFDEARADMEAKFANRSYELPGIILHVSMLRIWLGELGYLNKSSADLVAEAKDYIDAIAAANRLPDQAVGRRWVLSNTDSQQLGFHGREKAEFSELRDYFQSKMTEAYESQFALWADELRALMRNDSWKFLQRICWTSSSEVECFRDPIMPQIDATEFVEIALSQSIDAQDQIFMALNQRYSHGALDRDFAQEHDWFVAVRAVLDAKKVDLTRISAYRLQMYDNWYFAPVLDP